MKAFWHKEIVISVMAVTVLREVNTSSSHGIVTKITDFSGRRSYTDIEQ